MPHIHTQPDQHDMTVSGYIVRMDGDTPLCLVHMHRKIGKLMQVGGHIELNETPWQAMAHELAEESGYQLSELAVLQHTKDRVQEAHNVSHPVPFLMNTHNVGNNHYHSDLCYAFIADTVPEQLAAEGESSDLRWVTLDDLRRQAAEGIALNDVYNIYSFLLGHMHTYASVLASQFSLGKPQDAGMAYRYGAPGEIV